MGFSKRQRDKFKSKYGPWAVITGASSGIGRELSLQIASAGIHTFLTGRDEERLQSLKLQIKSNYKVEVEIIVSDLSKDGSVAVLNAIEQKEVGLFVASAGYGTSGPFLMNSIHEEVDMLHVNCKVVLEMIHHIGKRFRARKKGGVILLSSIVAFQGVPLSANYSATKAYIQSLAEGLYHEFKPYGVAVLAAAPGPVNSGFSTRANMQMGNVQKPGDVAIPILKVLGNRNTVLPGMMTKILAYSIMTVPRWAKVRIMKMVMSGMAVSK